MQGKLELRDSILKTIKGVPWERLYRLEIQKRIDNPAAFAPSSRFAHAGKSSGPDRFHWQRFALIYDVHDKTHEELAQLVLDQLEDEYPGNYRVVVYAWDGPMRQPQAGKHIGKGNDFLYSQNPRGELIVQSDEPIEFELPPED